MIIDLSRLMMNLDKYIEINEELIIDKENYKDLDIIDIEKVYINGYINKDSYNEYSLDLSIKTVVVLPCSITLKPVKYPIDILVEGNLEELMWELDKNYKISNKVLDIFPIIWDNVLVETPLKVTSLDASNDKDFVSSGDGWKIVTDEEDNKAINPELLKLKDLL